jgi:hypothetical protein
LTNRFLEICKWRFGNFITTLLPSKYAKGVKLSRLRKFPNDHRCEQDLGYDAEGDYRGFCADPAVIRCNACHRCFCEECWQDHLELTTETGIFVDEIAKSGDRNVTKT